MWEKEKKRKTKKKNTKIPWWKKNSVKIKVTKPKIKYKAKRKEKMWENPNNMFKALKYNDYTIRKVNADYFGRYPREGKDVDVHPIVHYNQGVGEAIYHFSQTFNIKFRRGRGYTTTHT